MRDVPRQGAQPMFPWLVELIEAPAPERERSPSQPEFRGDVDPDRARKWVEVALRREASALASVREGGRNNALNSAVFTLAGKAWCGLSEREVRDLMLWACGINKLIRDKGLPAFEATFASAWAAGIARPLPGPRDRDADNGGVTINLRPKLKSVT
jgi:hypothetical protein